MMMRASNAPSPLGFALLGLALTGAYVAATFLTIDRTPYDLWGAMLIGPVLIAVSLPIFAREARRMQDPRLLWILIAALLLKLIGGLLRYWVTFSVYGAGDATGYHREGVRLAESFWSGDFSTGLRSLSGTDFISLSTGVIYAITGPSKLGGFLFYSWLSFWGLFLFHRAFVVAVPEGDRHWYALFVFFLPSLLYWPSSTGKEAWMVLTLGIAAIGVARLFTGRALRGLALLVAGALLGAIVRPHVAGLVAIGAACGLLFLRPGRAWARLGPVLKWAGVGVVAVLAAVLIVQTQSFLGSSLGDDASVTSVGGVVSELEDVAGRADTGGSEFDPVIVRSPVQVPEAVVTVLFRPFLFEAGNAQGLVAALESTLLLVLVLWRWRWIWAAITSMRRQAYVAFAAAYTGMFVIVFASFPNFGLLARERVQVLPLFLVLLCVPPRSRRREEAEHADGPLTARVAGGAR
jgi:hypothetical protein